MLNAELTVPHLSAHVVHKCWVLRQIVSPNVLSVANVLVIMLASIKNVLTHVKERVGMEQDVRQLITVQSVVAHLTILEIHLEDALKKKNQQLWMKNLIHVVHRHVVQIQFVELAIHNQFAHALNLI